jgi:D-alanyl-D-alanine carboxypeptidase (penicillin-binding protein 5/6)
METEFPVSEHAWRTGGGPSGTSAMLIPLGSKEPVENLLQGIIVQSGNDACIVMAEGLAGTEEAFAEMMTAEARRIGLKKSTFGNSTGLPNPKQLMTARELAQLAIYLIKEYPEYYHYFAQKEFKYRKHNFYNRNELIYSDNPADGLKTGYTEDSGYGLVASAVRDGRRLVLVMNGFAKERDRKEEASKLLNWGFTNFRAYTVFAKGETVGEARVWGAEKFYVPLKAQKDVKILLPVISRDMGRKVKAEIAYMGPLKPPLKAGEPVAQIRLTSEAGTSNTAPLTAGEAVAPAGILWQGLDALICLPLGWIS